MSKYIPQSLREQIRVQFNNCCADRKSAERLTVAIFELEHIIPMFADGRTDFENLCLVCPACNRSMATHQEAPDPQSDEASPLFHPQNDQWSGHSA